MNKSFTLIETLVVLAITAILSAIIITYSHTGEKQIVLFRDQAKVIAILNRAKFLSVQMFSQTGDKPCAYGVHFDDSTANFLIFKDLTTSCDGIYGGSSSGELFEQYELDSRLKFETQLSNVVFIPPDPKVKLNNGALSEATIIIYSDSSNKKDVKINNFGQITAQ